MAPGGHEALSYFGSYGALPPEGAIAPGITRGLLVLKEPLDKILAGTKTWELRGKTTERRGPIALIESK